MFHLCEKKYIIRVSNVFLFIFVYSASNNVTKDIMMEMDMYLTLAYLIIETRRQLKLETSSSSSGKKSTHIIN